jgi:hypothetical protein
VSGPRAGCIGQHFFQVGFFPFFHAPCRRCLYPRPDAETLLFAPIWRTVKLLAAKEGSSNITRIGRLAMKVPTNGRLQPTHLPNRQIVERVGAARRAACRARIGCHSARGHRQSVRSVPRRVPSATRRTAHQLFSEVREPAISSTPVTMLCEAPVTDGLLQSATYHVDLHRNTASDLLHTMQSGMVWRWVSSGGRAAELRRCGGIGEVRPLVLLAVYASLTITGTSHHQALATPRGTYLCGCRDWTRLMGSANPPSP